MAADGDIVRTTGTALGNPVLFVLDPIQMFAFADRAGDASVRLHSVKVLRIDRSVGMMHRLER